MTLQWRTVYDLVSGNIVGTFTSDEHLVAINTPEGCGTVIGRRDPSAGYVAGDQFVAYTDGQANAKALRPAYPCEWSNTSFSWVDLRDLAQVKLDRWAQIRDQREAAIAAPLDTPYGAFDADSDSRTYITNAIVLVQTLEALGQPSSIDFTLADNSVVTLTAAQMVEVGLLLGQQVQSAHAAGRQRRALIKAANTVSEVLAVTDL